MTDLDEQQKQPNKFESLPFQFKRRLKRCAGEIYYKKYGRELEILLLDCLNNEKLSVGDSPIYLDRIAPDPLEIYLWWDSVMQSKKSDDTLVYSSDVGKYLHVRKGNIPDWVKNDDNITVIEDRERILSIIVEEKKKNRRLFGRLPYLGIENEYGELVLFEEEVLRPKYDKIKFNKSISLKNCIRILTGIDNLYLLVQKEDDIGRINQYDNAYDHWIFDLIVRLDSIEKGPKPIGFTHPTICLLRQTIKYENEWKDIVSFVQEFVKKISTESQLGIIKEQGRVMIAGTDINDINMGTYGSFFETKSFLKWAKESGYAIPDELSFVELEGGSIEWVGDSCCNDPEKDSSMALSGKERQELGRLRLEKAAMDLSIKAAIEVGRYIENAKLNGKLIVKNEIVDLVSGIELKIPQTRIDQIWKTIPDEIKHGPGRPKK